jgi:hypothetical protein
MNKLYKSKVKIINHKHPKINSNAYIFFVINIGLFLLFLLRRRGGQVPILDLQSTLRLVKIFYCKFESTLNIKELFFYFAGLFHKKIYINYWLSNFYLF